MFQNTLLSKVLSCFKVTTEGAGSLYFGPTLATPSYGGSTAVVSFAAPPPSLGFIFQCTSIFNVQQISVDTVHANV